MLTFTPVHATFGAEVHGADLATLSDAGLDEIKAGIAKYGFLVFRDTGFDDDSHVAFSKRLGDLDNIARFLSPGRKMRYRHLELFDAGNLDADGNVLDPDSPRAHQAKGNCIFHVDSSFNPRRASYCLLRAVQLPPAGAGGNTTDFADSRTAYDTLPADLQQQLLANNYVGRHCIAHSRKLADPEFYHDLDPGSQPHMRHHILQRHEPSGRLNLYVGAHLHSLETEAKGLVDADESTRLIQQLNAHVSSAPFVTSVTWQKPGDIVMWDNRAVQHRAGAGSYGTHKRDLRRTTVHDDSPTAWGLNATSTAMPGFVYDPTAGNTTGAISSELPAPVPVAVS
ncbi:alpha-ketoglutarate-dependent 2,4-dichlorophenoxyacetate dioxygenase [Sporothrix brasiliensis 5110]|uniref:Alpha-ketoglutarate-dependent 2,4-dichlorophenoxyacetate dioxygenase n=1 Tax=Sporothrix brasiliensis 5110 TaxID=1398154 RepID=A0A0C2IAQ4_9PEZI|nr:alpha-ketoglutarate-dependent 2,4-dichlorophenoxyacetate dioxygenase [Sporothrix brasiliensis 5110]KIH86321.1 alpha-ketoglutarate-dependent 2,4-dichlorophenoxyacetate dioxygenase [Sporothrix brasiliensis 5110]